MADGLRAMFGRWLSGRSDAPQAVRTGTTVSVAEVPMLDALVASLPDGALVLDRDGRVLSFNKAAHLIAPALARGQPASLALRVPEVVEAVREVAGGNGPRSVEFTQRVPVDRWFMAHVRALDEAAAPAAMMLVFHDLTPLYRVEQMRADFIANASHELRTPLASLSGFVRHAARVGEGRRDRARALPRHHEDAGRPHGAVDRRPALALAHRVVGTCASRHAGGTCSRSCGRWSMACRPSPRTVASR